MGRVGVSITKTTSFRNSNQEFSNVYYYESDQAGRPTSAVAEGLIDAIVGFEKTIHAANVTFVRGRCWSQEGSPATNEMIVQKQLSGTGSVASATSWDKERAYLFRLRAGVDSRGNPVYFRKWYHTMGAMAGVNVAASIHNNTSGFSSTERGTLATPINSIKTWTVDGVNFTLTAKGGRDFNSGANFEAHPFLEHHQLGDQWRAQ